MELTKEQQEKLEKLKERPIGSWEYPRVLVTIPLERAISHADQCFWQFMAIAQQGPTFFPLPYQRTDLFRNKVATKLLQSDFTHLLMLDIDHIHPADIIQRLAKWYIIAPQVQVVGGLNFRRGKPFEPCAFKIEDGAVYSIAGWGKGLVEVDALGTGCIMVAREVFEQIEPPWFYNSYERAWRDEWPGEDIGFSNKCRDAGIKLYCDTTLTSPHLTTSKIDESTFRNHLKAQNTPLVDIKTKKVLSQDEAKEKGLTP